MKMQLGNLRQTTIRMLWDDFVAVGSLATLAVIVAYLALGQ
ncbi:MAG TPA: hypothetical protein VKU82_00080 [Planctomycetaceae bacterium]|nr:hypothetical protein [Planctomycetaceae bacterium]